MNGTYDLLRGFVGGGGASSSVIDRLLASVPIPLPADYVDTLRHANGGEGFVGQSYLRLYPAERLEELNRAYAVEEFAPGIFLIGSSSLRDAYAFDMGDRTPPVVRIPFIPMDRKLIDRRADTFTEFLSGLAAKPACRRAATPGVVDPDLIGKELHARNPIPFGGSPTDPANQCWAPVEAHTKVVVFWNRVYKRLTSQSEADQ